MFAYEVTCTHSGQFDGGGPFQPHGQQQYNRQRQPMGDQQYGGYDRQGSQGQYGQRYSQQYDSQDQRWGQPHMAGGQDQNWNQRQPMTNGQDQSWNQPMDRRNNQQAMYQNIPGGGPQCQGGAQYDGQRRQQFVGAPYGGAPYDGGGAQPRGNQNDMYNQQQGMNQGGMQLGPQQGYQRGGPPARGVQDVSYGAKEAWTERQPFTISMFCYCAMLVRKFVVGKFW